MERRARSRAGDSLKAEVEEWEAGDSTKRAGFKVGRKERTKEGTGG